MVDFISIFGGNGGLSIANRRAFVSVICPRTSITQQNEDTPAKPRRGASVEIPGAARSLFRLFSPRSHSHDPDGFDLMDIFSKPISFARSCRRFRLAAETGGMLQGVLRGSCSRWLGWMSTPFRDSALSELGRVGIRSRCLPKPIGVLLSDGFSWPRNEWARVHWGLRR